MAVTTYVQLHMRANQRRERGGIGSPWPGHSESGNPRKARYEKRARKQNYSKRPPEHLSHLSRRLTTGAEPRAEATG